MGIPVEYRRTFDADLLAALRDVAGVATQALHPFMLNIDAIAACFGTVPSIACATLRLRRRPGCSSTQAHP